MSKNNRREILNHAINEVKSGNKTIVAGFSNDLNRKYDSASNNEHTLEIFRKYMELFEKDDFIPLKEDIKRISEKADILDGSRNRVSKLKAAIRYEDLNPLLSIGRYRIKSKQVTSAPTANDFNALRSDVDTIYKVLSELANLLASKTI
jgi:hypothetical protein